MRHVGLLKSNRYQELLEFCVSPPHLPTIGQMDWVAHQLVVAADSESCTYILYCLQAYQHSLAALQSSAAEYLSRSLAAHQSSAAVIHFLHRIWTHVQRSLGIHLHPDLSFLARAPREMSRHSCVPRT